MAKEISDMLAISRKTYLISLLLYLNDISFLSTTHRSNDHYSSFYTSDINWITNWIFIEEGQRKKEGTTNRNHNSRQISILRITIII